MRIYKETTVFEESLNRIRRIFDEFEDVYVTVSGGKDSTVLLELARIVAREKNRLPLKVCFLDQEAEWQATIDLIKEIMYDKEIKPYWFQIPIKLFNATSTDEDWLYCWKEGEKWMREKDPISIKENRWGTDRFADFFRKFLAEESKGRLICDLTGMRAEESPNRLTAVTEALAYKDISWGRRNPYCETAFTFHPIYDGSYLDVWKAIHYNKWKYNKIYDYQYQYGVPLQNMRVSNLHHETAVHALFFLQEFEPDTYNKLTERLSGVDTAGKLGEDDYFIHELPYMFADWREYRDYLLENLITDKEKQEIFAKKFKRNEEKYLKYLSKPEKLFRAHIQAILANDYHGTKLKHNEFKWRMEKRDVLREERRRLKREMAGAEIQRSRKQN